MDTSGSLVRMLCTSSLAHNHGAASLSLIPFLTLKSSGSQNTGGIPLGISSSRRLQVDGAKESPENSYKICHPKDNPIAQSKEVRAPSVQEQSTSPEKQAFPLESPRKAATTPCGPLISDCHQTPKKHLLSTARRPHKMLTTILKT